MGRCALWAFHRGKDDREPGEGELRYEGARG
jgi:hypothetical protein